MKRGQLFIKLRKTKIKSPKLTTEYWDEKKQKKKLVLKQYEEHYVKKIYRDQIARRKS